MTVLDPSGIMEVSYEHTTRTLPYQDARRLTDLIKVHLGVARDLLRDAIRGQAWKALGYPSWDDYCAVEFAEARLFRLPPVTRCELVADLAEDGLSNGVIAAGLGISEPSVRNDLKRANRPLQLRPVIGADGKTYRRRLHAVPEPAAQPTQRRVDVVVADLHAAGARGMTAPQIDAAHGWDRGTAGAVLSELHRHLRVARLSVAEPGGTRDRFAVYVHVEHVAGREVEGPGRRSRRAVSAAA